MNKLLAANFMRMKKSKVFGGCILFMLLLGTIMPVSQYLEADKLGLETSPDGSFFVFAMFIGMTLATFCGLFFGTEYGDGTVRNKVIVGHKRSWIYGANLVTGIVAGLLMCAAFIMMHLIFGALLLGSFTIETQYILLFMAAAGFMTVSFASVFTAISMLNQNKAVIAVICILFSFVALLAGQYIQGRLDAPEMYEGYAYTDDSGKLVEVQAEKNPRYLEGTERKVYEFMHDLLPGDQQIQIAHMSTAHPWRLIGYSAALSVIITSLGRAMFRRKYLK